MLNKNSCFKLFLRKLKTQIVSVRYKHKETHWSVQAKKKTASGRALEHFDDFYKSVYGKNWFSIRQGLLADHKYVAIVNNYGDNAKTITDLENTGALNIRKLFKLHREYLDEQEQKLKQNADKNVELEIEDNRLINVATTEQLLGTDVRITNNIEENNANVRKFSVEASLKTAKIDASRIINPGITDLSSALYEFVPATQIKGGREGWIPETQHYKYYENTSEYAVSIEQEYHLHFPEHLDVYCYEKSNHTPFDSPRKCITNVLNYYLLDGGSLLPVLALGLQPGDRFLDLCAAPGGKTIIALQTLYPDVIMCNDCETSRVKRIHNVLRQYVYDLDEKWFSTGRLKVIQEDGRFLSLQNLDKILVDVPCTNDRLSVRENENNWFKSSRTKERIQLPEVQAQILSNALKMVRVGGTVVYSTCSLSPIQNDGIVNMALKQIWEETDIKIIVKDLTPALEETKGVYKFADKKLLRYGHLVVPYLPQNYGPMYFCKLQRTS